MNRKASGFGGAFVSCCSWSSRSRLHCSVSSAPRGPACVALYPAGIGRSTAKTPGPPGSLEMARKTGKNTDSSTYWISDKISFLGQKH
uniref:Uncharacterized protein n=1 Tax=Colobus angolensis palliatus TaxID=336983 RepID=A0A2K5IED4_COLAP